MSHFCGDVTPSSLFSCKQETRFVHQREEGAAEHPMGEGLFMTPATRGRHQCTLNLQVNLKPRDNVGNPNFC